MAEEISNPLLSLVKEQGLIDDLQYEEVAAEFKRSGTPVIQLLQDFGIMKLDDILQVMANHLGTDGRLAARRANLRPNCCRRFPAKVARMYQCLPVAVAGRHGAGGAGRPARPGARRTKSVSSSRRTCRWWWPTRPTSKRRLSSYYGQEESERRLRHPQGTGRGHGHRPRSQRGRSRR